MAFCLNKLLSCRVYDKIMAAEKGTGAPAGAPFFTFDSPTLAQDDDIFPVINENLVPNSVTKILLSSLMYESEVRM